MMVVKIQPLQEENFLMSFGFSPLTNRGLKNMFLMFNKTNEGIYHFDRIKHHL